GGQAGRPQDRRPAADRRHRAGADAAHRRANRVRRVELRRRGGVGHHAQRGAGHHRQARGVRFDRRRREAGGLRAGAQAAHPGGGVIGLGLGLALAPGLKALFKAFGADLPSAGLVVEPRTVIVALLVAVVVTVLSSLAPALRATRVPPIAALREGAVLPPGRFARFSTPVAVVLIALGAIGLGVGLFGGLSSSGALSLIGSGAGALFIGVA